MAEDPYRVLGVSQTATDDEIRRAFRKLAKESHPDLHPGDKAAEERFKKINAAFAILGEADKRRQFDQGLIDAAGEPRRHYGRAHAGSHGGRDSADEFGFGDIFSDLFGRNGRAGGAFRGQDVRYSLEVEFLESVNGARKRVTLPDGGVLDLTVPEGVSDGQVLRLRGKGAPGPRGGEPGDALVEVKVRPHPQFRRSGDDILCDVPITIDEAVLGGRIEVSTIAGRVQLTIPKGTDSGRAFRLKGKGVKAKSGGHGDQIVTVRIVLPQPIDESLAFFLGEWRKKHAYNPGRS